MAAHHSVEMYLLKTLSCKKKKQDSKNWDPWPRGVICIRYASDWLTWNFTPFQIFWKWLIPIVLEFFQLFGNYFKLIPTFLELIPNILELIPNVLELIPNILKFFQLFWKSFQIDSKYFGIFQLFWKWLQIDSKYFGIFPTFLEAISNWFQIFWNFSNFFGNDFKLITNNLDNFHILWKW